MQENNQLTSQVSELVRGIAALTTEIRVLVTRVDHQSKEFDSTKLEVKKEFDATKLEVKILGDRVKSLEIDQAEQKPIRGIINDISKQIRTIIVGAVIVGALTAYYGGVFK